MMETIREKLVFDVPESASGCKPGHEAWLLGNEIVYDRNRRLLSPLKAGTGSRRKLKIAELGSGIGALTISLAAEWDDVEVVGFEVQSELVEAARFNVVLNGDRLKSPVQFVHADIRDLAGSKWKGEFDLVAANPPFYRREQGRKSPKAKRAKARHEIEGALEDFVQTASLLLRRRGRSCFILRPDRLDEYLALATRYGCPVKSFRPVYSRRGDNAKWVIARAVKGAKPGLEILPASRLRLKDTAPPAS